MNPALWAALGATAALLLVLLGIGLALVVGGRRVRAQERAALAAARADVEALNARLEDLSAELAASRGAAVLTPPQAEYVITTAGDPSTEPAALRQVPDQAVLSVTLGQPLIKLAALGYGVRKALSGETRNRIAFEMRREVKRARKERRRAARRTRLTQTRAEEAA